MKIDKKTMVIIGIVLILIIFIIIILTSGKNTQKEEKKEVVVEATPTLTREEKTGGLVEQTPEEEKVAQTISDLRLAAPIDAGTFTVEVNWKNGKFMVKKKNTEVSIKDIEQWLNKNGYEDIPLSNFEIK